MKPEVTAAIIALSGVLLSLVVSVIFSIISTKFGYRRLFAETVSTSREKWLCIFRENLSKFLACAEMIVLKRNSKIANEKCSGKLFLEYEKEFYESRAMMMSRLNMQEDLHQQMYIAMSKIDISSCVFDFNVSRENLLMISREFFKYEWSQVKDEARGKKRP